MEAPPQAEAPQPTASGLLDWIAVAALAAVFAPAVLAMAEVWSRVDYYSHGYLVPLVALWAAAGHRRRLAALPARRELAGLLVVAAALALYLAGLGTSLVFFQGIALVMAVAGLVLFLRGRAWLRTLAFPVAYLLFMVPIPDPWIAPVIVKLQLFVSSAGVALLQGAGVPVYQDGNVIEVPGGQSLFVAEACSGITSLITLLPLGVFLAYFTERTLGRRLVIVAAVVPLAMIFNLVRVVGTVLGTMRFGAEVATGGPVHESAGLLTYVLGCLALLGVGAVMRRVAPDPERA